MCGKGGVGGDVVLALTPEGGRGEGERGREGEREREREREREV